MIKNFNVPLLNAFGEQSRDDQSNKPLRIADVAILALTSPTADDGSLTEPDKIGLASLACRIAESTKPGAKDGGAREYSKEELVTIKKRASKNCLILPFVRLCEVIDSDEAKADEAPKGPAGEST